MRNFFKRIKNGNIYAQKKVNASKQIIVDLPEYKEGDEAEILVVVNPLPKMAKSKRKIFDMKKWADQWETDLGEDIQSTNVEQFTGRSFYWKNFF